MKKKIIKVSSNRSFGIVFFIFFLIVSIYPLSSGGTIRIWTLIISIILLILGLLNSSILSPFNKIWFKLGILIDSFVSPVVMAFIYFFVITPISFLLKLLGKDTLNLKKNNKKTYWIEKLEIKSKMKDQF